MRHLLNWLLRRNRAASAPAPAPDAAPPIADAWSFLTSGAVLDRPPNAEPVVEPMTRPPQARPAPVAAVKLRKLIVYGNCQAAFIETALNRIAAVRSRWTIVRHDLWATGETLRANLADFDECDVLLLQELRNWRTHPRHDSLPPGIRVVRFPFCYYAAMWPFDAFQNGNDPNWRFEKGRLDFNYADNMLGRLRSEVPDPEQRFACYRGLGMPDCIDIVHYAEFEAARLLRLDRKLCFTIGQYILDNFRTTRLFHAITHPAAPVMVQLIEQILAKLDIRDFKYDQAMPDILGFIQVPIHPLVIERLGLKWASLDDRYKFTDQEFLTFDEYVRRYISAYG
jgi:hypothetical protein